MATGGMVLGMSALCCWEIYQGLVPTYSSDVTLGCRHTQRVDWRMMCTRISASCGTCSLGGSVRDEPVDDLPLAETTYNDAYVDRECDICDI